MTSIKGSHKLTGDINVGTLLLHTHHHHHPDTIVHKMSERGNFSSHSTWGFRKVYPH